MYDSKDSNYNVQEEYVNTLREFLKDEAKLYKQQADEEKLEFLPDDEQISDERIFSRKYKYPKEFSDQRFGDYEDNDDDDDDEDDDDKDYKHSGDNEFDEDKDNDKSNVAFKPIIDVIAKQDSPDGSAYEGDDVSPLDRDFIKYGLYTSIILQLGLKNTVIEFSCDKKNSSLFSFMFNVTITMEKLS